MFYGLLTAAFQYVDETDQVGINICIRIFERIPDAGLSSQIHHDFKSLSGKQIFKLTPVAQIDLKKFKTGFFFKIFKPGLFEGDIIIRVHIVNAHDLIAVC